MKKIYRLALGAIFLVCFSAQSFAAQIGEQEVEVTISTSYNSRHICEAQDVFSSNDGS